MEVYMKISIGIISGILLGIFIGNIKYKKKYKRIFKMKELEVENNVTLFHLMNLWVKVKQKNKGIADYLINNKYKKIAIYGMGYVGETLFEELKNSEFELIYYIDKNAAHLYSEIPAYEPEDNLPSVDVVIVTAIYYYEDIKNNMKERLDCPILSLEGILYEILECEQKVKEFKSDCG